MINILFTLLISFSFAKKDVPGNVCSPNSGKITVCHATGSEKNPYVNICVSLSSLWGHFSESHNNASGGKEDYIGECGLKNVKSAYACNAGLKHEPATNQICRRYDQNPNIIYGDCGTSKHCECSGTDYAHLLDYFTYDLSVYNPFDEEVYSTETKGMKAGNYQFNVATDEPAFSLIPSDTLSFNLSSERMNSEYFVDICWTNTTGRESYELAFDSYLSVSDYRGDYLDVAKVESKTELYCDQTFDGILDHQNATLVDWTNQSRFSVSSEKKWEFEIKNAEFCFLRHRFKEFQKDVFRPNELKNIRVKADVEALVEEIEDGPIRICYDRPAENNPNNNGIYKGFGPMYNNSSINKGCFSKAGSGKKNDPDRECCLLEFTDSEHLRSEITSVKENLDIRDIHNKDWVVNANGTLNALSECHNRCGTVKNNNN